MSLSSSLSSDESLFGRVLDDLIAYRAGTVRNENVCGACGRSFDEPGDVFSHDCDYSLLPRTITDPVGGTMVVRAPGDRGRYETPVEPARPVQVGGDAAQRSPRVGEPIDPAKVEAWLVGLGRKVEDRDVTPRVERAAREWIVRQDICRGEFMASMQERADKGWRLSVGQVRGIMNIWRSQLVARQDEERTVGARPARADYTTIPESRYAYTAAEGTEEEHTAFCKVEQGTGRWAGRTFVTLLVGAPGHFREIKTSRETAQAILAKIAVDPKAASVRFGHEVGACGRCGSPLTDPESIAAGIGPVCATKF